MNISFIWNQIFLLIVILMVYVFSGIGIKEGFQAIKSGKKDLELRPIFGGGIIKIRGAYARVAGLMQIFFMSILMALVTFFLIQQLLDLL